MLIKDSSEYFKRVELKTLRVNWNCEKRLFNFWRVGSVKKETQTGSAGL